MRTDPACFPCFRRQVERTLVYAGVNGTKGERITALAEKVLEGSTRDQAPARISTFLHRMIREETGLDPYRRLKESTTRIALERLPALRTAAAGFGEKGDLEAGARIAIAGNIIDFGIFEQFDLDRSLQDSLSLPLPADTFNAFSEAVRTARRVLYLCDNAGEIVYDRILLEALSKRGISVTAVVKGVPVINDATMEDAVASGLGESAASVIENGNDGIGTLLELCSSEFMNAYRSADLVISKGQANYETLADERDTRIFFLFKVKCPVVAKELDRPEGDIVLMENRSSAECGVRSAK